MPWGGRKAGPGSSHSHGGLGLLFHALYALASMASKGRYCGLCVPGSKARYYGRHWWLPKSHVVLSGSAGIQFQNSMNVKPKIVSGCASAGTPPGPVLGRTWDCPEVPRNGLQLLSVGQCATAVTAIGQKAAPALFCWLTLLGSPQRVSQHHSAHHRVPRYVAPPLHSVIPG